MRQSQSSKDEHDLVPSDEEERLKELRATGLLESNEDVSFDDINTLSSLVFAAPVAYISLMEESLQWFQSTCGIDMDHISRDQTICKYTIYEKRLVVIPDAARDPRLKHYDYVKNEPHVRFYAGAIIRGPTEGKAIGTLCVMDFKPRAFGEKRQKILQKFAELVERQIKLFYERRSARNHSLALYYFDELTGLPNSALFEHYLSIALKHHDQDCVIVSAVALSDFDHLHKSLGASALGELIIRLFERVQSINKHQYTAAYDNEGRFLLFTEIGSGDQTAVTDQLQKLKQVLKEPLLINQQSYYLNFSIGASLYPQDGHEARTLIQTAKEAQKIHAESGQGPFSLYNKAYSQSVNQLFQLENRLSLCLANGMLDVALQPVVRLTDEQVCGYEALCRWHDTVHGTISPARFVPMVLRLGKMHDLTVFVLERVCEYISRFSVENQPRVAVNTTFEVLYNKHSRAAFKHIIESHDIKPDRVHFEITEDDLVSHFAEACDAIEQLRQYGITFSIDDFGTGYSALNYLTRLPVERIKIDKSLIQAITISEKDAKLVRLIIHMNHELGYETIAEGVETAHHADLLRSYNCGIGQGFYWGHPQLVTHNASH